MSDPNDPQVVYTIGLQGPSGLPMLWQGALAITPSQSPYSAKVLQPVPVDCRTGAVTVQLPALTDSSTCVVAIKDLYGASATNNITVLPVSGLGTEVEVPGSPGTYASTTVIASNGAVVWYVAMFSINAWIIWVH
jgi:hypothetical protein